MDPAICEGMGGCYDVIPAPRPESAYEIVVDGTTYTVYPDVPEYTVSLDTLYSWGELKQGEGK